MIKLKLTYKDGSIGFTEVIGVFMNIPDYKITFYLENSGQKSIPLEELKTATVDGEVIYEQ